MGDIVCLVERAAETIDQAEAEKMAAQMREGPVRPRGLRQSAASRSRKMGGLSGILGMLPGVGKIKPQIEDAKLDYDHPEAPGGDHRIMT